MRTTLSVTAGILAATFLAACSGGGSTTTVTPAVAATPGTTTTGTGTGGTTPPPATPPPATPAPVAQPPVAIANARTENPRQSDALADSIGVDVHLHYTGTAYADSFPAVQTLLVDSGIRHIRDGVIDTTWQPFYDHLNALGRAGVHADLITSVNQSTALLASYPSRVSDAIESFEGPNEYDRSGDPNWSATLAAFQRNLWSAFNGRYPVIGPSLTSQSAWGAVGDLSGSLDYGNMHDYFAARNPGTSGWGGTDGFGTYATIGYNMAVAAQASKAKPIYSTETGYGDVGQYAVPAAVKARYTLRTLLEQFNAGVRRTYLYEFLDEGNDGFGTYGLVTSALAPKPAYTALKTFIAHLSDKGPAFTAAPLTYELEAGTDVHHTLLQRRDGTYSVVLWLEVAGSNPDTAAPYAVTAQSVTLSFPYAPKTSRAATIGDDGNATPLTLGGAGTTITLPVSDRVTILDLHF
ncbi:MAG: hypothetical protein JWO66_334 [Candidatus Eremiobacteraeota bacterium]|nr:hypothetical protein [Candidatus Eremiobacteraeota bacterium]